jgi:sporulation protein YlmC with PRC-barrel domain
VFTFPSTAVGGRSKEVEEMSQAQQPTMIRLGDTDRTIPNPDEDIRGRRVIDRNGEQLGKVADLLIDDTAERARFLIVEHGGILGLGASQSFIPVEAVTSIDEDDVRVNTDMRTVAGAPGYDPGITTEPKYYQDVYGYYGVTPYWTVGPDSRENPDYDSREYPDYNRGA